MSSHQEKKDTLNAYEEDDRDSRRPAWLLSWTEIKLLGIVGVGFFLDAYDLFIINQVATMLQYLLYGGKSLPSHLGDFMKAGANIGSVIGQFFFGYMGDAFGRKAVYGKELMVIIFGTIMTISAPTNRLTPNHVLVWIAAWRIVQGVGVGGDYPLSASVATDRASIRKRGVMLGFIFSNQGWGSFVGSLLTMIVLLCYKHVMDHDGDTHKVDGAWRIIVGLSLIPAFATIYQRLTLPEATRYKESIRLRQEAVADGEKNLRAHDKLDAKEVDHDTPPDTADGEISKAEIYHKKHAHYREFLKYMSEWRHLKILIGTAGCWFLLDVAFYGINLNTNVVLQQIGFGGTTGTAWTRMFKIATGNLIITALGFVPGYWVTILTVNILGRKWIQIQGFLLAGLFLAILAGRFSHLSHAAFVVNFALLQFFFNFGANATTFLYPAEVFPTRFRASAHGVSAAAGKAGAIISALAFNTLAKKIGTPKVLWIFFACCMAGAILTLLLPEVNNRDADEIDREELRQAGVRA